MVVGDDSDRTILVQKVPLQVILDKVRLRRTWLEIVLTGIRTLKDEDERLRRKKNARKK
jgi:hypothetical protein